MARGSVVKKASGNYAIRYQVDGRRYFETIGPNKRDAERALAVRLSELQTGVWAEPTDESLAEYAERWLESRDPKRARGGRSRLSHSTYAEYTRALRRYVLPQLGQRPLAAIRPREVDAFIHELERQGKAPGTVRNILVPFRTLLVDALRQGLIPSNPAAGADLPPAQEFGGKEIPAEHTTAIRRALEELAPTDPLTRGPDLFYVWLFDVALGTGMRMGELRALQWGDIEWQRRVIRIQRAYSRDELKRPKTDAGRRSIPLFPTVEEALMALRTRAERRRSFGPTKLVFAGHKGTPLHPSNFNRRSWQPALRLAGLDTEGYRFHDLRHTCVSRLVGAGADVKLVQAVAGHASPMLTLQRYSHLLEDRVAEAARRFDPAAGRRPPTW